MYSRVIEGQQPLFLFLSIDSIALLFQRHRLW